MKIVLEPNSSINENEINLSANPIEAGEAEAINNGPEAILNYFGEPARTTEKTSNRVIKIFLASSIELKEDRALFETFIYRETARLLEEKQIFLKLEIWENFFDAMSPIRKQEDYHEAIILCDIFVIIYSTKVGKYSAEEFDKILYPV